METEAQVSLVPVGESINLTHTMLTYFCNNASMRPNEGNRGKNTNLPRAACVLRLANSFVRGADNVSTLFVLAAARRSHGTCPGYLSATKKAARDLMSDDDRCTRAAGKKLRSRISLVLAEDDDPSWAKSLGATMWDYDKWGQPPSYFNDKRPALITVQGQHRFTVFLHALRDKLGLEKHRAGMLSDAPLFQGEGAEGKAIQLAEVLQNTGATCSVVVHSYLDHVQSAAIGHLTHDREGDTNHPYMLDAVAYSAPLICQLQRPKEHHCEVRAKEFFEGLPVNDTGDTLSVLGMEWTDVFLPKDGTPAPKKLVESRRKMIKAMQGFVKKDVADNLARVGMPEKQSSATLHFVYAAALYPDSPVVKSIVEQLTATRDNGVSNEDMDCEVLAMLFRLSEQSQRKEEVWRELGRIGFSNPMRKVLTGLGRIELFEGVVSSLALRVPFRTTCDHRIMDLDSESVCIETGAEGSHGSGSEYPEWRGPAELARLHSVLLDLCIADDDAMYFTDEKNKNLKDVILEAGSLFLALSAFVGGGFKPGEVTKKFLSLALGRIAKADPTASNKSQTVPGAHAKTGNPLPVFISISGTPVPFDRQVLAEYLAEGKGYGGRVMFMCLAILVIDRALSKRSAGDHLPQRFENLLKAMPACAAPLKEALVTRAGDLVLGGEEIDPVDREPFFDAKRLEFLKGLNQEAPRPEDIKTEGHRVSIVGVGGSGTSSVQMSLPTSVMQALGIMTEAGTVLSHATDVRILPSIEEDSWHWGQESREREPQPDAQPTDRLPPPNRPKTPEGRDDEGASNSAKRKKTKANKEEAKNPIGEAQGGEAGEAKSKERRKKKKKDGQEELESLIGGTTTPAPGGEEDETKQRKRRKKRKKGDQDDSASLIGERTAGANNATSLVELAGQEELLGERNEMEFNSNTSLDINDPAPTVTALSVPGDESEKPSAPHDDSSQKVDDPRAVPASMEKTSKANTATPLVRSAGQEELLGERKGTEFTSNASFDTSNLSPPLANVNTSGDESEESSASDDDSKDFDDALATVTSRPLNIEGRADSDDSSSSDDSELCDSEDVDGLGSRHGESRNTGAIPLHRTEPPEPHVSKERQKEYKKAKKKRIIQDEEESADGVNRELDGPEDGGAGEPSTHVMELGPSENSCKGGETGKKGREEKGGAHEGRATSGTKKGGQVAEEEQDREGKETPEEVLAETSKEGRIEQREAAEGRVESELEGGASGENHTGEQQGGGDPHDADGAVEGGEPKEGRGEAALGLHGMKSTFSRQTYEDYTASPANVASELPPKPMLTHDDAVSLEAKEAIEECIRSGKKERFSTEGQCATYFKKELASKSFYKNFAVTSDVEAKFTMRNVYVTMPKVIQFLGTRKVGMQELMDVNYASFMYRIGEGPGSLFDLVNGETTFPKSRGLAEWLPMAEPESFKRRRR